MNLLEYTEHLTRKSVDNTVHVLCHVRKKWMVLTPEETVRQLLIHFMINECSVPIAKIAVERKIQVDKRTRRFDILVYDHVLKPLLLVECKSIHTKLNQQVMEQISHYNSSLKVAYLLVSNGLENYLFKMDYKQRKYTDILDFPNYSQMLEKSG